MALGSTIGVGLFLGSANAIKLAGPATPLSKKLRSLGLAPFRYVPGRVPTPHSGPPPNSQGPEPAEEETAGPEEFLWEES